MPSDYGHKETDRELKALEEKINKEYKQAAKELQEKFYAHMKDFERIDAKMKAKLDAGKITKKEYQNWRTNQMLTGQRMNALYESLANDLVNADQIAAGMINDSLPDVYALNMNYSTYKIEHTTQIDTNFTLYDRKTVENLMKDNPRIIPQLTPKQKEKIAKDELWNRQHLVSAVAQGILQGEGIPDIAKRLQTVAAMDDNAATRNARTYITAAQNKGRIDSYERAEKLGIKTNKKWIATLDDRTRVEHRHLDGVSIPYSDVFKMDGYEIEYPGDPSAEPEMIYNCFIGDTSAYTNCDVIRSYAHQYDGDLIEIKTASGVNFTCTPNHPILTLNGWVSAASLHNGDDLLVTRIGNKFGFGRYCNIQHVFSSMKTFHDSLKRNGTIERNAALRVNFHGDIPTSKVEIVTQKRFLSNNGYPSFCESVKKFLLKFSDKTLFCKCTFMEHFRSVWLSTLGDIRSRSKLLSFFKRHLGHSEVHRLRPIALFDARGVKPLQNDVSGNIERISDCLNGFSGIVFADNIVNINISSRCTHVYNLQTENGYYFVNSIISQKNKRYNGIVAISHNCRCTLVDDILDWPYNDERRDEKLGDMTYEEWKHAKDKPGKDGSTKQDYEIRVKNNKGDSYAESLIDKQYSPHIAQFNEYAEYRDARKEYNGEETKYIEDLSGKDFRAESAWKGGKYYDDKIPRIEATLVDLNEKYPIESKGGFEYGTKLKQITVCDYDSAWFHLPDGQNDRRLTDGASGQVFIVTNLKDKELGDHEGRVVIAFNRESLFQSVDEVIKEREERISKGIPLLDIGGGNPELTACHEYGHIMSNHIDNAFTNMDETANAYWEWYQSLAKEEIRNGLSDYATTNRGEFEAECFAELQCPNPRPIALKFKEYLDEIIEKGY